MDTKNLIKWLKIFMLSIVFAVFSSIFWVFVNSSNCTPKLSVVVPIYNVEDYLPKCLDSLIGQTFEDLEIICVNDGSLDNCLEILKEYEKRDSRIIVIDKTNGGVSSARNAGMRAAKAEYITFVDPDDYLSTNVYEKCMYAMENKNADIVIFNSVTEPENKFVFSDFKEKVFTNKFEAMQDQAVITGFVWNKIFKRSIIVDNDIWFNENIKFAEDNLFVNMVFPKAEIIVTCTDAFYHYLIRPDSSGKSVPEEICLKNAITRSNELIDFYKKQGYTDRYIWLLDWCLAIIHYRLDETNDIQKRKKYSGEIIDVLEKELLPEIHEPVPEDLIDVIDKLKGYASV